MMVNNDLSVDWDEMRDRQEEIEREGLYIKPVLKDEDTVILIQNYWTEYWTQFRHVRDPEEKIREPRLEYLYNFFHWLLTKRRDSIKAESTLQLYWATWCQIHYRVTLRRIDPGIRDQMRHARRKLANEFGLQRPQGPKSMLRIEDEFELHKALFSSPYVTFPHERHRVELLLLSQIAGITGNRPGALLALRYEHIRISTILVDGVSRPIIDWEFAITKSYRGSKPANKFPIPNIPFEPCLLLCPETAFLALAFADEAFAVTSLKTAEQFYKLQVTPGTGQLPILWKESILGQYIFRRSIQGGQAISDCERWSDDQLNKRLKMLGSAASIKPATTAYVYRRGAAEGFDNSSLISEQQRNAMLQHESSDPFRRNYLSRHITQDVHAIRRGFASQTNLIRAATGMSRTIDPRRPRRLTAAQVAEVDRRADLRLLARRMEGLQTTARSMYGKSLRSLPNTEIYRQYAVVKRDHLKLRRKKLKDSLKDTIDRFDRVQPNIDLQRQLDGLPPLVAALAQDIDQHPLVSQAFVALFTTTPQKAEAEMLRRHRAVATLTALCHVRQGPRQRCRDDPNISSDPLPVSDRIQIDEVLDIDIVCKPTQCIFCLGDINLDPKNRLRSFHRKGDLWKHWQRRHMPDNTVLPIACPHPSCETVLRSFSNLRNHADRIHGTPT